MYLFAAIVFVCFRLRSIESLLLKQLCFATIKTIIIALNKFLQFILPNFQYFMVLTITLSLDAELALIA